MEAIVQVKIMLFEAIWQITEMIIICPCNYTHTDSDLYIYWHRHFYILSSLETFFRKYPITDFSVKRANLLYNVYLIYNMPHFTLGIEKSHRFIFLTCVMFQIAFKAACKMN